MADVSGDFEIHISVWANAAGKLAGFAEQHSVKLVHIMLDRGLSQSQPMLTLTGSGTFAEQQALAGQWEKRLRQAGIGAIRTKIEAAPWCTGIPRTDEQKAVEPAGRYFEHHVKVLFTDDSAGRLTGLVAPHGARLSRNARRQRADGAQERFVNQRCHDGGLATAKRLLDALVTDLRAAGYEILDVEQEYVMSDTFPHHDAGWLQATSPEPGRSAPPAENTYPATYRPLAADPGIHQRRAFDPALKQHVDAYRVGEPVFRNPVTGQRWTAARRAAMNHVLTVLGETRWAGHLVLRGSVTMATWCGAAAREPGDLDFVVTPAEVTSDSAEAGELSAGIPAAILANPGAGLQPERTTQSAIWTYERADGRRLVIPFSTPEAPDGTVQIDIVFGEHLPIPPAPIIVPGVGRPVLAATAELSLAWKLMWLATDWYPQGKDLYDAVLLAEYTTADKGLVRELIRPELGADADLMTTGTFLPRDLDWRNFEADYPAVAGTAEDWKHRLTVALERAWS